MKSSRNLTDKITALCLGMLFALMSSCSITKFVPQESLLLEDVKVLVNDSTGTFTNQELLAFVRHRPNTKFFNLAKLRLGVYNLSGTDSSKWWNKWIRRIGEPPVIFDSAASFNDRLQLLRAVNNAGFLHAEVTTDSLPDHKKRKMKLQYNVNAGEPHIINSVTYEFSDDTIRKFIEHDSLCMIVKPGNRLDRSLLGMQRDLITTRLQSLGYWSFSKDYISFNADTTAGSNLVDLTMTVRQPRFSDANMPERVTHRQFAVRKVICIPDYNPADDPDPRKYRSADSIEYKGITILYGGKRDLRPSVIAENCFLRPGAFYNLERVNDTYAAFGRLSILRFVNIRFFPSGSIGDIGLLDAYILLTPGKSQYFSIELEGTNSEGDLGLAAAISYSHRNLGHGSETLTTRLRGSYQSLTGNLEGFIHNRFMEYGIDASLTFPKFKFPLLKESFKRKIRASTEINLSINYQERPEYTRIISAAGWNYKWARSNKQYQYTLTPIDISYVYLPASTYNFLDQIAPDNPLLRYSYEDHFIMRAGFNFYHTTKKIQSPWEKTTQRNVLALRVNTEIAGNLLFLINTIFTHRKNYEENPYKVFGTAYSQYVRAEGDFSFMHVFDKRHSLALHAGFGIGIPYGNSTILPFEKRFYGGGSNGVRGWDVRTLGPGRYPSNNSQSDFIYQCGDIKMLFSIEYRAKLFWVLEAAAFIDAGNIWTIRDYTAQPDGVFRFNSFYKEFASAYGIGIRLDFSYFLLRFDLGMKAHNPAVNAESWPLIHPKWSRDHSFHFSIGYPF